MSLLKPCLSCGEPGTATRCDECRSATSKYRHRPTAEEAGYDKEFQRLSKRARRLQPWCLRCTTPGTRTNPLTAQHTPQTWEKRERGEKLRVEDFEVLCRRCNSLAGPARKIIPRNR